MSPLKTLLNEIHRRSLWQVLGVYLAVGWLVLQVTDQFVQQLLLPAWRAGIACAGVAGARARRLGQGHLIPGSAVARPPPGI